MDGRARDREQLGQVADRVLTGIVHAAQLAPLLVGELGLLKAAPRRSRKAVAQGRRLVKLVATIHNAADGETRPELTKCAGLTHKLKNNNRNMFINHNPITCTRIMLLEFLVRPIFEDR
jgi:hypothetical protein